MMDKQKKESPPGAQSVLKSPGFKIPKKKPDDWCEDIPTSSPLTRLNDRDLRNVTLRRREYKSSYEAFNSSRNKDSHQYYTFSREPKIILKDILRSGQGTHAAYKTFTGSLSCNDGKCQINPVSSSSHVHPPASESVCMSRAPRELREQHREREMGMKNEVQSQVECKEQKQESQSNKVCCDVSNTSVPSCRDLIFGPRKSSNYDQEGQDALKAQEQKNFLKGIEVPPARRENTYCYKRAERQNKKRPLSPSSSDLSSSSSEPFTDRTLSCTLDSPTRNYIASDKIKDMAKQNKKSSDDGCSSDPPKPSSKPGAYSRTRRKPLTAANDSMKNQPIVLSSDEDEAAQKETKPGFPHTVKKTSVEKKCPSPTKDAELMDPSGILEDATVGPEQSNSPVLELKLLNVYYGKKRGRVSELAKFTATSIDLPLKVPLHKDISLSVETKKLKKYGFWLTKGGDSVRSSAVIILWITSDYVPVIEKQMELSARKQTSKANELIFLELVEPLNVEEQSLIKEIMVEASKHGSPSLADVLTWEEMDSMLESLPSEECAFKLNCFNSGSKPPEVKKLKSTYSLSQKWSDNGYSFSMVPKQHNLVSEAQRSGAPIRLLVYPPPPTKGGLGVSNEDLQCLEHGEFLNDVIIDFYLKYLLLEIFPKPSAERCHIFSSFFFRCLTRKENNSNDNNHDISAAERRHQRVKNWTRHVDIFTKDFIFVPVNENSHWYLAVICFPWLDMAVYEDKKEQDVIPSQTKGHFSSHSVIVCNDRLSKAEEEGTSGSEDSSSSGPSFNRKNPKPKESHIGKVCKRPCILIFDSLRTGSVRTTVQVLRDYLQVEFKVKQKSEREFSRSSMRDFCPKVPKQNNSTDCGLYLLQYVETFFQKPIENFEPPMHLENWFPSCVVKNKREEIRDLILRLHVEQKRKT